MKIRTVYLKVHDVQTARAFWEPFLGSKPHQSSGNWCSFRLENVSFALVLNDPNDSFEGTNCVPVFEFKDDEVLKAIEKAKKLDCQVLLDGLNDPNMQSVVLKDPSGNEFEISKVHS